MNAEERRRKIRERTQKNYDTKDQGGYTPGKSILNLDIVGGYKKEMFYKPEISERGKEVMNRIDILPFIVTTNNLRDIPAGDITYNADVVVHRKMGPGQNDTYLCLENMFNEPCPVCEDRRVLKENKSVPDTALNGNPLGVKRRCLYNVVNLNLPKDKRVIQIFEEIHFWFEKKLLEATAFGGGKFTDFWDPEFGCSVEFIVNATNTSAGKNLNYVINFTERKDPKKYSDKIMEQAYPLDKMLIRPAYEEVRNAYFQVGTGDSEPDDDDKFSKSEKQEDLPVRDVNSDLRRPSFDDVDPHSDKKEPAQPAETGSRRSRRQPREDKSGNPCPYNHVFGKDNDNTQDCSQCSDEIFRKCDDERVRLGGE